MIPNPSNPEAPEETPETVVARRVRDGFSGREIYWSETLHGAEFMVSVITRDGQFRWMAVGETVTLARARMVLMIPRAPTLACMYCEAPGFDCTYCNGTRVVYPYHGRKDSEPCPFCNPTVTSVAARVAR